MGRGRLEAFSDAVIAIILTIMVLELKSTHGHEWSSLGPPIPVDGRILCANLHLMFWLSLIPATTAWMGESHFATAPTILYGVALLACALAYMIAGLWLIPDRRIARQLRKCDPS